MDKDEWLIKIIKGNRGTSNETKRLQKLDLSGKKYYIVFDGFEFVDQNGKTAILFKHISKLKIKRKGK